MWQKLIQFLAKFTHFLGICYMMSKAVMPEAQLDEVITRAVGAMTMIAIFGTIIFFYVWRKLSYVPAIMENQEILVKIENWISHPSNSLDQSIADPVEIGENDESFDPFEDHVVWDGIPIGSGPIWQHLDENVWAHAKHFVLTNTRTIFYVALRQASFINEDLYFSEEEKTVLKQSLSFAILTYRSAIMIQICLLEQYEMTEIFNMFQRSIENCSGLWCKQPEFARSPFSLALKMSRVALMSSRLQNMHVPNYHRPLSIISEGLPIKLDGLEFLAQRLRYGTVSTFPVGIKRPSPAHRHVLCAHLALRKQITSMLFHVAETFQVRIFDQLFPWQQTIAGPDFEWSYTEDLRFKDFYLRRLVIPDFDIEDYGFSALFNTAPYLGPEMNQDFLANIPDMFGNPDQVLPGIDQWVEVNEI